MIKVLSPFGGMCFSHATIIILSQFNQNPPLTKFGYFMCAKVNIMYAKANHNLIGFEAM